VKFEIPKPLQQVSNDLGSLGVFLIMRWIVGLKGAILATVLYVVIDLIRRIVIKEKITRIFWIISVTTISFGTVDLLVDDPFMLKFEAVLTNLITAFVFAATVSGTPLALEIARTWQTAEIPDRDDTRRFFQIMTWIWVGDCVRYHDGDGGAGADWDWQPDPDDLVQHAGAALVWADEALRVVAGLT